MNTPGNDSNVEILSKKLTSINKDLKKLSLPRILIIASLVLVVITVGYFIQRQQEIRRSAAAGEFLETFDGDPSVPTPWNSPKWDIQYHRRDIASQPDTTQSMQQQHGHDCGPPPNSHASSTWESSVYNCKNHVMTALRADDYGVIYLTPNVMVDFSQGPAVVQWDMSTERMSSRDWPDLIISPWEYNQATPLISTLSHGVDLQGPPKYAIHVGMDNGQGAPILGITTDGNNRLYSDNYTSLNSGIDSSVNQAATRQTFKLTFTRTSAKFERVGSATAPAIVYWEETFAQVPFDKGVVQLGHHSYTPTKDNAGVPATWHWDNVMIQPSIPFTMIKADKRYVKDENSVITFAAPAPENSFLRFNSSHTPQVSLNGGAFVNATRQWEVLDRAEGSSSYWHPVPVGTQNVRVRFQARSWFTTGWAPIAKDFAIWSQDPSVGGEGPTATNVPQPTNTPTQTVTSAPTATNAPVPTSTSTPTPTTVVSSQSALNLSPTSSSTTVGNNFSVQVRVNTNGQTVNGVDASLSYPVNLLDVMSINDENSNFEIKAESTASNGVITLAYGASTPKSGNLLVATINFRARAAGVANVNFSSDSQVLSNVSNSNVLNSRTNGVYTLVSPTPTPTKIPTPTSTPTPTPAPLLRGDMNNDGKVDVQDLSYLLSKWRTTDSTADLNKDGRVNVSDLSILLSNWTK